MYGGSKYEFRTGKVMRRHPEMGHKYILVPFTALLPVALLKGWIIQSGASSEYTKVPLTGLVHANRQRGHVVKGRHSEDSPAHIGTLLALKRIDLCNVMSGTTSANTENYEFLVLSVALAYRKYQKFINSDVPKRQKYISRLLAR